MWKSTLLCAFLLFSGRFAAAQYDYGEVLGLALMFYEAERSGKLPEDNRIPWRFDSALDDKGQNGEDLTGGYYDAGDHVKFGFPMAYSVTVLAWGFIQYHDSYDAAGQTDYLLATLKWGTDYFIKAHTAPTEFYAQVGDGNLDHGFWGRPEDMTMERPAFKIDETSPGSDIAAETAAAFAASSIAFRTTDPDYSATLLDHAVQMYDFAYNFRAKYSDSIPEASFYTSYTYNDELVWGAVWLYRASNNQTYLDTAESLYEEFNMNFRPGDFSWDDKLAGVQVLLAQLTEKDGYIASVTEFCDHMVNDQEKTPKGLLYVSQWGTLRTASNIAWICLEAAELGLNVEAYRELSRSQIDYALGSAGRSFVVGYGENPPTHVHHRGASCPDPPASCEGALDNPDPNPHVLYGALAGGPGENDEYTDLRTDYVHNEVACDYNAAFTSSLAALNSLSLRK